MPPKKRGRVAEPTPPPSGNRRRSQRNGSSAKKSSYFEPDVDDESDGVSAPPRKKAAQSLSRKRGREAGSDGEESGEDPATDQESDDDEEEPPPRKRGRPAKKPVPAKAKKPLKGTPKAKAEANGGSGDDDDDDDDDEEAFQPQIVKLPQLRDTGGVDYEDTRLHPNTLLFLKDLKANNQREWLKMRDPEYRRSLKDWESFVETLTEKVIEVDETIPELPLKDVIFRIYRDIRFSKDPTPYKPHYSVALSRTGRKGPYACYYVHVEPGGSSFVGGGLWQPDKDALARLRASIDERPRRWRRLLTDPAFREAFLQQPTQAKKKKKAQATKRGKKADDDEDDWKSAVAAFCARNKEYALKTRPRDFPPDHPLIELLKLRNFTVSARLRDEDLTSADAEENVMAVIRPMVPFISFLNSVVKPDPGDDSDSEDEDEDGDEAVEG